ncbi:MAG: DNA damage-inducible protein DinB [Sphingobacteriales bacterium 50-39]|nr:DinB family protein [Sphingobacteriales bacterium]OJW54711.1 MAG: DNA damage-inducible protein DinB [Sphingobacteriales bacterium 50-39]
MSKKNLHIPKPQPEEFPDYAAMYIKLPADDGRILEHLKDQIKKTEEFVNSIPANKWDYVYAPGKWTIKEVLVHIIDDERIYAYRALRIGRGDTTPLPGFEEKDYVPYSKANDRTVKSILKEYETVRKATLSLYRSFSEEDLLRKGTANNYVYSTRALLYHMAGHELHHLNILKEKYLE